MSILLYVNGYHEKTFADYDYLRALNWLDRTEYEDCDRALIFHDGMEQVWLKKVEKKKTKWRQVRDDMFDIQKIKEKLSQKKDHPVLARRGHKPPAS